MGGGINQRRMAIRPYNASDAYWKFATSVQLPEIVNVVSDPPLAPHEPPQLAKEPMRGLATAVIDVPGL
jgi:hypothetical protein